ncbi:MAG: hypothetical protein ABIR30_02735 [Chitinophagaceae bacterium]
MFLIYCCRLASLAGSNLCSLWFIFKTTAPYFGVATEKYKDKDPAWFDFLGIITPEETENLPSHYSCISLSLFEIPVEQN